MRAQLLDTAELIMKEEGYPAVTTRRLASRMGVSNQLVHYYFHTMDELFLSLMRRGAERSIARLVKALTSADPLQALWQMYSDPGVARLQVEFLALFNHRKVISGQAKRSSEQMRTLEAEAIERVLKERGHAFGELPATALAVILSSIGRIIAMERNVGISLGHADAMKIVERAIQSTAGASRAAAKSKPTVVGATSQRRPNKATHRGATRR